MKSNKHNRRKFLSALSAGAAGSLVMNTISPFSSSAQSNSFPPNSEWLFAPGMVYLNTGTLGPCRRETIEETKKAWEELETFPVIHTFNTEKEVDFAADIRKALGK